MRKFKVFFKYYNLRKLKNQRILKNLFFHIYMKTSKKRYRLNVSEEYFNSYKNSDKKFY